jgi:hypothetical protein
MNVCWTCKLLTEGQSLLPQNYFPSKKEEQHYSQIIWKFFEFTLLLETSCKSVVITSQIVDLIAEEYNH